MLFKGIRYTAILGLLLTGVMNATPVIAQGGGYNMFPQMQTYLSPSDIASGQVSGDMNIPSITEGNAGNLLDLPEMRQPEFSDSYIILMDKKIDPEQYMVGPGDYLSVYLWGELDKQYSARVSPEGQIIIPTVGSVMVSDMSLADAETRVLEAVDKVYVNLDVTVNLLVPRRFRLYVSGLVDNPGFYEAHGFMRVSDLFVELAQEEAQQQTFETQADQAQQAVPEQTMEPALPMAYTEGRKAGLRKRSENSDRTEKKASSKRMITVHRGDAVIPVDLLRFEKMGDIDSNPYVSGGDRVFVPGYRGDIFVEGEVNDPGIYEYKPGDTIRDLVAFGGGLTSIADTSLATLVRFDESGRELQEITINLYDALNSNPDHPSYRLHEADRLFIKALYDYKEIANVRVQGEVQFPGFFAITPNVTQLTDIIRMAGGFTDEANLEDAQIVKPTTNTNRDLEYERLRAMPVEEMTEEEYEYFKLRSRTFQNVITIDFVKLFREDDASQDILLEPGDNIVIPKQRELVNVLGAVQQPGYVRIEPGEEYMYYINKAGGYNWNAKTRKVRIVKSKTGQQFKPDKDVAIEGGDTILVPEEKEIDYWLFFQETMDVFANVATLIILAQRLME